MATINATNPTLDRTVQIFDSFYNYEDSVSAVEYDVVVSYFRSVFESEESAENFTVALFRVSQLSNTPVMTLLQSLQGKTGPQLTLTFAYYLNTIQHPSTMLGVQVPVKPNFYISHNIRA